MATEELGWHRYVLRALTWQWNLLVLGGAVAAALISGHADVALPLVLAAEGTYLAAMTANPRFRKSVDSAHHKAIRAAQTKDRVANRVRNTLESLTYESRQRFIQLRERCLEMKHLAARVRGDVRVESTQTAALDRMLWTFLRLLASEHALEHFLSTTDTAGLKQRVSDLERDLRKAQVDGDEKILRALVDSSATAQLRLDNLEKAQRNERLVKIELDRIEDKIKALVEMAVSHEDPDFISSQVDSVAASISDTEAVMREMAFVPGVEDIEDATPLILSEVEHA